MTGLGAVIIGHLADTRLAIIGTRYLKEVELRLPVDSNASRQEITQLTEGMRHVRLPTDTTPQVKRLQRALQCCKGEMVSCNGHVECYKLQSIHCNCPLSATSHLSIKLCFASAWDF